MMQRWRVIPWIMLGLCCATSAAAPASYDPCGLISKADASAALGLTVKGATLTSAGAARTCNYETGHVGRSVMLTLYEKASAAEAKLAFAGALTSNAPIYVQDPVMIKGVGDEAAAFSHILWVRKNNVVLVMNVIDASVRGQTLDRAKTLAAKAVAKIR